MISSPLIDFKLDFQYEGSKYESLADVSGIIQKGKCIVLTGPSGSGKSTLLKTMNRLIPEFNEGKLTGFIHMNGKDLGELSIGETGLMASSVFQDPRSQFFTLSSTTEVAFGLENFGLSHEEIVRRVDDAFRSSGLERLKDRNVFELSSGERQLVAILAAKAVDTDIMLLDEPTANLDLKAINDLEKLLISLKSEGKTLVISEHRLHYLSRLADEYWILEKGRIARKLTRDEMLSIDEEELSEMGLRTTELRRIHNSSSKKSLPESHHIFRSDSIGFSYSKGNRILEDVSFEAESGDVIGLIGANGSGKTTLGKTVSGLLRPGSGNFTLDGDILKPKDLKRNAIFIMQEAEFQFFSNTVLNELDWKSSSDERKTEIQKLLEDLDMWHVRNQHPFSLSGGQMQKLVLLMAYLSPKPIAVLDEPTAGLDGKSLKSVVRLIQAMARKKIIFIITHDEELLASSCTKAFLLGNGRIEREFNLLSDQGFEEMRKHMENDLEPEERNIPEAGTSRHGLDPRTRFLLFIIAMVAGLSTGLEIIYLALLSVMIAAIMDRNWKIPAFSLLSIGILEFLDHLFPGVAMSFVMGFFPRIILLGAGAAMICQKDEASRSLAAMRRLHIPENVIMVVSVMLRFFPVLRKDIGIMNQSIATRGFLPHLSDKLKSLPRYAEILIVPMVFRVTRIAESLSASAETRGIALKNRRESLYRLHFTLLDGLAAVISAVLITIGILISIR